MNRHFNPGTVALPSGTYSHGVEVPPDSRLIYVSGQVGVRADGSVGTTIEEQAETVWTNISEVLADAGLSIADIVKVNSYLTRAQNIAGFRTVREKFLGASRPASTLLVVQALAHPEYLLEVEVVAARTGSAQRVPARHAKPAPGRTAKRASRKTR